MDDAVYCIMSCLLSIMLFVKHKSIFRGWSVRANWERRLERVFTNTKTRFHSTVFNSYKSCYNIPKLPDNRCLKV